MGNRAIIKPVGVNVGLYLHWNGGCDSVEAFLKYCEMKKYRGLGEDSAYGLARLCQVVANYFGGGLSVGIVGCRGTIREAEGLDNGIYVVKGWNIVDRVWWDGKASNGIYHEEQKTYDLNEMIDEIDQAQPESEKLGYKYLHSIPVPVHYLKIGDRVYLYDDVYEKITIHKVMGIGEDRMVNGVNVKGIPYVDRYLGIDEDYTLNINNYIFDTEVRKVSCLPKVDGK